MNHQEAKGASEEQTEPSAVMERLSWQLARRDDKRVAQALYAGEELEEMHELSEAGLLDEFFVFLEEIGLMAVLEELDLPGVQRVLVPTVQFVLLYLLKVLYGGQSMNELPRVLFSNVALMELVGFNAQQVEEGLRHSRGCATHHEEEAGTAFCAEPGRYHQQTEPRANGTPLQPDGAVCGRLGTAGWGAQRGPRWQQIANASHL
jgi:hypothetical protein